MLTNVQTTSGNWVLSWRKRVMVITV